MSQPEWFTICNMLAYWDSLELPKLGRGLIHKITLPTIQAYFWN